MVVERAARETPRGGQVSQKVDCYFIEEDGKVGGECSECHAKFFDRMSKGEHPRMLESGIGQFLEHAKVAHHSSGGIFKEHPQNRVLTGKTT